VVRRAKAVAAIGALALAACGGPARPAPVVTAVPVTADPVPATEAAPAIDDPADAACRDQAATLTATLQQILAQARQWYAVRERGAALVVDEAARSSLGAIGSRPLELHVDRTFHLLGGSSTDPVEVADRAAAIVASQPTPVPVVVVAAPDARWADVASLTVALQRAGVGEVGFGFAVGSARLPDNRLRERLALGPATAFEVMNDLGADQTRRCPAVGELFLAGDEVELLSRLVDEIAPALIGCRCAVSPTEVAEVVDVLLVPDWYLGLRRIALDPAGGRLAVVRGARFDEVAPKLLALPDGARLWFGR
jgi:hypothetical protein